MMSLISRVLLFLGVMAVVGAVVFIVLVKCLPPEGQSALAKGFITGFCDGITGRKSERD